MTIHSPRTTKTDLLVIGAGPAGLSATLTFARLGRSVVTYDSQIYRNAKSQVAHTIPGFDGQSPKVWREKVFAELGGYKWVEVRDGTVVGLRRVIGLPGTAREGHGDGREGTMFEAEIAGGNTVLARKVVLATGIKDVLPAIPEKKRRVGPKLTTGLEEIWGTRAIHCIYCHGTETRHAPLAFLLASSGFAQAFNAKIVESALKLWPSLGHPALYFLTNGMDITSPADLDKSGLKEHLLLIKRRGYGIITDPLDHIEKTPNGLLIHFKTDRTMLPLGHIAVLPESWAPNPDAASWLTKDLLGADLSPTGTIAMPDADAVGAGVRAPMMPRMGDDPRTAVRGLFWAGNVGSFMANVNLSVSQGQGAAVMAADELGSEDLEADR